MNAGEILPLIKQAASEWVDDDAPTLGAALAYYTVFSLAPLLLIAMAIAGIVFGQDAAQGKVFEQLHILSGDTGGRAMQELVKNAAASKGTGELAALVGGVTLLFGASTVFVQLQTSLNTVWGIQAKPGQGLWAILKRRLFAFGLLLGTGFLLLLSVILTTYVAAAGKWMEAALPGGELTAQTLNFAASLIVTAALFALLFRTLPDAAIGWSDVWGGALMTAVLFVIGKSLIGIYLGKTHVGTSFGAAGSLIALLVWVYYSAQIFLFGAELTQVYTKRFGSQARLACRNAP